MSELINLNNRNDFRRHLLTTVSALVLAAAVCGSARADDADSDHPSIWIELGGQTERQTGQGDAFIPTFLANTPAAQTAFLGFVDGSQKVAPFSNGLEGKVTFQPDGTEWVFSAAVLYGRTNASKGGTRGTPGEILHGRTLYPTYTQTPNGYEKRHLHCCLPHTYGASRHAFMNIQASSRESHAVVDFQVGRDVGLGLFGKGGSSVVSAGVRFAQFVSQSHTAIQADPAVQYLKLVHQYHGYTYTRYTALPDHFSTATADIRRSFHGFGPAVSWNGSALLLGNSQAGGITVDWGANAAVLFGRQSVAVHHKTFVVQPGYYQYTHVTNFNRRRAVTVPNVGGLAGVSFRYANAKVSFGYRGDFFFGAMDVGVDTRKTNAVGFYGPFASLSIGIGG